MRQRGLESWLSLVLVTLAKSFLELFSMKSIMSHDIFTAIYLRTSKIEVVKYSYIQAIVLAH